MEKWEIVLDISVSYKLIAILQKYGMIELEKPELEYYEEYSKEELVNYEYNVYGFYLLSHHTLIYKNIIDDFTNEPYNCDYDNEHFMKFKHILDNIWFLPYSEIDKLKETIISEINGVDNNESNDTSIK